MTAVSRSVRLRSFIRLAVTRSLFFISSMYCLFSALSASPLMLDSSWSLCSEGVKSSVSLGSVGSSEIATCATSRPSTSDMILSAVFGLLIASTPVTSFVGPSWYGEYSSNGSASLGL